MPDLAAATLTSPIVIALAESTALLGVGLAGSYLLRRRAALAHAALLLTLLAALLLPLASWSVSRAGLGLLPAPAATLTQAVAPIVAHPIPDPAPATPAAARSQAQLASTSVPAASSRTLAISSILFALWATASLALLARLAHSLILAIRIRHRSTPLTAGPLPTELDCARAALCITRPIDLHTSADLSAPVICCWGTPCILIPAAPSSTIDWRAILTHELAHLLRRDHLSALIAELALCLLPWHPLLWLARRRLALLAEHACDDWALSAGAAPHTYAESLLTFAVARSRCPLTPAIVSRSTTLTRITHILHARPRSARLGTPRSIALAALSMGALTLAALAQPAQPAPAPAPAPPGSAGPPPAPATAPSAPKPDTYTSLFADEAPKPQPSTDYAARLAALDDTNWRAAFALGREIAALPGDQGWTVTHDNWAKIPAPEARQQLLKAWITNDMRRSMPATPHVLDALDLGIHDPSPKVQQWAIQYLRSIAFQDFALDIKTYDPWHAAHLKQTVVQARNESCLAWITLLKQATTAEDITNRTKLFRELSSAFSSSPETASAALSAGLFETIESWITRSTTEPALVEPAAEALDLLRPFSLSREQLERVVVPLLKSGTPPHLQIRAADLLGKRQNSWAIPILLDALRNQPHGAKGALGLSSIARALADTGDPSVIPPMIALIAADNTEDTIYGVGYFGLSKLTSVSYDKAHDGPWWRDWWEHNKQRFPEPTRSQTIP